MVTLRMPTWTLAFGDGKDIVRPWTRPGVRFETDEPDSVNVNKRIIRFLQNLETAPSDREDSRINSDYNKSLLRLSARDKTDYLFATAQGISFGPPAARIGLGRACPSFARTYYVSLRGRSVVSKCS
jgi:hypothetical protein